MSRANAQMRPPQDQESPLPVVSVSEYLTPAQRLLAATMGEKELHALTVALAKALGWRVWFTLRSTGSPHGWPDLVLCRPPALLVVELKRERGTVTPRQSEALSMLSMCGLTVYVWRPSDWLSGAIERELMGR